eukprot:5016174-Amphidinium_carterae.1
MFVSRSIPSHRGYHQKPTYRLPMDADVTECRFLLQTSLVPQMGAAGTATPFHVNRFKPTGTVSAASWATLKRTWNARLCYPARVIYFGVGVP